MDTSQPKLLTTAGFVKKLHDIAVQKRGYVGLQEMGREETVSWYYGTTLPKDPTCGLPCSWTAADPSTFLIRGETYLDDHKKIKSKGTLMHTVAAFGMLSTIATGLAIDAMVPLVTMLEALLGWLARVTGSVREQMPLMLLEERLDPMPLGECEEEPGIVKPLGEKYQIDTEQIKFPDTETVRAEENPQTLLDHLIKSNMLIGGD